MDDGIISKKDLTVIIIGFVLLAFGIWMGGAGGVLFFTMGFAVILGFLGGQFVRIIVDEFGGLIGIVFIFVITILFGYLSSLIFGWALGIFIGFIVTIVIIILNVRASHFFNRP